MIDLSCRSSNLIKNRELFYEGRVPYIPLYIGAGFLTFSILSVRFGPLDWKISNPFDLYGFLFLSVVLLVLGYCFGTKYKFKNPTGGIIPTSIDVNLVQFVCGTVFLLIYFPTCYTLTGKWYPDIVRGIFSSGEAYRVTKYLNENTSQFVLYIRFILSPLLILIPGITVYYYQYLNMVSRILGVISIALSWFLGISQGISKNTADLAILLFMYYLIVLLANTSTKRQKIKSFLLLITIILVFAGLYFVLMKNRVTADVLDTDKIKQVQSLEPIPSKSLAPTIESGSTESVVITFPSSSMVEKSTSSKYKLDLATERTTSPPEKSSIPDKSEIIKDEKEIDVNLINNETLKYATFGVADIKADHFLLTLAPDAVQPQIVLLFGYLTHGYKGLSYALDKEFTSSYGLGFSDFIRHNILRIVGLSKYEDDVFKRTYMSKIESNNWPAGLYWSTFFVYPASDFSFWGVLLLMFFVGLLFSLSWKDSVENKNPFSITVFVSLCTLILYIPANNQLFLGGESTIGFIGCLLLWFLSHSRFPNYFVTK